MKKRAVPRYVPIFWRVIPALLLLGNTCVATATDAKGPTNPYHVPATEISNAAAFARYHATVPGLEIEVELAGGPRVDSERDLSLGEWIVVGVGGLSPPMVLYTGGFSAIAVLIGPPLDLVFRGARSSVATILATEPFLERIGSGIRSRLLEQPTPPRASKLSVLIHTYGLESPGQKPAMLKPLSEVCFTVRGALRFEVEGRPTREHPFAIGLDHHPEMPPPHCGNLWSFGSGEYLKGVIYESAELVAAWAILRASQSD